MQSYTCLYVSLLDKLAQVMYFVLYCLRLNKLTILLYLCDYISFFFVADHCLYDLPQLLQPLGLHISYTSALSSSDTWKINLEWSMNSQNISESCWLRSIIEQLSIFRKPEFNSCFMINISHSHIFWKLHLPIQSIYCLKDIYLELFRHFRSTSKWV